MKNLCEICGGEYIAIYTGNIRDGIDDMQDAFWKASLEKNKQSDNIYMELIAEQ
jgi:hypothetical protein